MVNPILKIKYAVSTDATKFLVTDITGAYDPITNINGWGGPGIGVGPNWDLRKCAIWSMVKRKASTGDEFFTPTSVSITTNPTAVNTDQTAIEFIYSNDGVLDVTMGILKVSTDGINYLQDAAAIQIGDYFYWNHNGYQVYQNISGINTPVGDLTTLVGITTIAQTTVTDIIEAKLAIIKQGMYKKWRLSRDTDCDDADPLFQELLKLSQDIQGSIYAFYSGLTTQAQSQVETMLDRYSIINQELQTQ